MMGVWLTLALLLLASGGSFLFATLAYSLRRFSRARLGTWLEKRGRSDRLEPIVNGEEEMVLSAAVVRAAMNLMIVLLSMRLLELVWPSMGVAASYGLTFLVSLVIVGVAGVILPLAIAEHAAEPFIGYFAGLLRAKRLLLWPVVKLHAPLDALVRRVAGYGAIDDPERVEEDLEKEILDIVQEGREEGVIDEAEREMIERAIRFHDVTAGQAMTARPAVVGLPDDATPEQVLEVIEESGYSRVPVYVGNLDKVVGVLYARDLFRYVGKRLNGHTSDDGDIHEFRLRSIMRQPLFVPETKPLADLLRDFQLQKVHVAIVLDEYGGTAGLVTIEDVLEELVGEIADEHEDDEEPMFRRMDDGAFEADARLEVESFNRLTGLGLPEGEGFGTLGGFITTHLGQIPPAGTEFVHAPADPDRGSALFTVLDAEPQRVNRVRVELRPAAVASDTAEESREPVAAS